MNGIMALKKGGTGGKKSAKFKKEAKARYKKVKKAGEAARARYQDDNRENYKAKGVQDSLSDKAFLKQQEILNRQRIIDNAAKGEFKRSDLTGHKDGLFGLRAGNYKDTGQYILNPTTGNEVFIGKARQGMDSADYANWVQKHLGGTKKFDDREGSPTRGQMINFTNPRAKEAYQDEFGFASGKTLGNLVEKALPAPLKWGLDAFKKFKNTDLGGDITGMVGDLGRKTGILSKKEEEFVAKNGTATDAKILGIHADAGKTTEDLVGDIMGEDYEDQSDNERIREQFGPEYDPRFWKGKPNLVSSEPNPEEESADVYEARVEETIKKVLRRELSRGLEGEQKASRMGGLGSMFPPLSETDYDRLKTDESENERIRKQVEQEFLDTYGVSMRGNIEANSLAEPDTKIYGLGDRLTRDQMLDSNDFRNYELGKTPETIPGTGLPYGYDDDIFASDEIFSKNISTMPPLGKEIRTLKDIISNSKLQYADGGSMSSHNKIKMSTYDKLKAIADNNYG